MKRVRVIALLLSVLPAACVHYTSPPAIESLLPGGVEGTLTLLPGTVEMHGELLTIDDGGYTMLVVGRVAVVPFPLVEQIKFPSLGIYYFGVVSSEHFEELRYASGFPYGIPDVAMAELLRANGQEKPDTVKSSAP